MHRTTAPTSLDLRSLQTGTSFQQIYLANIAIKYMINRKRGVECGITVLTSTTDLCSGGATHNGQMVSDTHPRCRWTLLAKTTNMSIFAAVGAPDHMNVFFKNTSRSSEHYPFLSEQSFVKRGVDFRTDHPNFCILVFQKTRTNRKLSIKTPILWNPGSSVFLSESFCRRLDMFHKVSTVIYIEMVI